MTCCTPVEAYTGDVNYSACSGLFSGLCLSVCANCQFESALDLQLNFTSKGRTNYILKSLFSRWSHTIFHCCSAPFQPDESNQKHLYAGPLKSKGRDIFNIFNDFKGMFDGAFIKLNSFDISTYDLVFSGQNVPISEGSFAWYENLVKKLLTFNLLLTFVDLYWWPFRIAVVPVMVKM